MRKLLISVLSLLLISGIVLWAISVFIDWERYQQAVVAELASASGYQVDIAGEISGRIFPTPRVTIPNVTFTPKEGKPGSKQHIEVLAVEFSYGSLMQDNDITLRHMRLLRPTISHDFVEQTYHRFIDAHGSSPKEMMLSVVEGKYYHSPDERRSADAAFSNITGRIVWNDRVDVEVSTVFDEQSITLNADIAKQSDTPSFIDISSDIISLNLKGKLSLDTLGFVGDIRGNVPQMRSFVDYFFAEDIPLLSHIYTEEQFGFSGTLDIDNERIDLRDIALASESIKGTIAFKAALKSATLLDVKLNLEYLDIDSLVAVSADEASLRRNIMTAEQGFDLLNLFSFSIPDNSTFLFETTAKEVRFRNQSIAAFEMSAGLFNKEIFIDQFYAKLPDNSGVVEISGKVVDNGIRPQFIGDVVVIGQEFGKVMSWLTETTLPDSIMDITDFSVTTALSIEPKRVQLQDFEMLIGNMPIAGSLALQEGSVASILAGDVNIGTVDLNSYIPLLENIELRTVDFTPLSLWNIESNIDIGIADMMLDNRSLGGVSALLTTERNMITLQDIDYHSSHSNGEGKIELRYKDFRPFLSASLAFDTLDVDALLPENTPLLSVTPFRTIPFELHKLDNIDGEIQLKAKQLRLKQQEYRKFNMALLLEKQILLVRRLFARFDENTEINLQGRMNAGKTPGIALSFALNNMKMQHMPETVLRYFPVSGHVSLSGSLSTSGTDMSVWRSQLIGDIQLAARGVNVPSFDAQYFIQKAEAFDPVITNLTQDEREELVLRNISLLEDAAKDAVSRGYTLFEEVNGHVTIANGIMSIKSFDVITPNASAAFAGSMRLLNLEVNTIGRFVFIPVDRSNQEWAFDLTMKGPLSAPSIAIDTSFMNQYIEDRILRPMNMYKYRRTRRR